MNYLITYYCKEYLYKGFLLLIFIYITMNQLAFADDAFISLSDIHFDPYFACTQANRSCKMFDLLQKTPYQKWQIIFSEYSQEKEKSYSDTNYTLLKSTLEQAYQVKLEKHPQFVLILGDFLSHNFREQYYRYSKDKTRASYHAFVKKTLQFLTNEIEKTFPQVDVYPLVGNNDSYTGDYSVIINGDFFRDTSITWSELIKNKNNLENFRSSFLKAGYYEIETSSDNKIIMLNTVLFSEKVRNKSQKQAALLQLNWLHKKLEFAKAHRQHVILAFHIPIGIDPFATIKNNFDVKNFWQTGYMNKFETELKQFSTVITAMLAGHVHRESFQFMLPKQLENIPIYITPSVSPIFGNNPAFKVYYYDSTSFKITKFETYYYSLNQVDRIWKKD